jgi:hypothetical protein
LRQNMASQIGKRTTLSNKVVDQYIV